MHMITLYTWTTPNGRKASIALEEMGLPYDVHPINIGADAQFSPEFLAISPNNKIPAIVHHDAEGGPVSIFESGAILTYLAELSGQYLPAGGAARARVFEWLFWQVGGPGPMLGQLMYFANRAPEKLPLAINRFRDESVRLLKVADKRLCETAYLGGADYSIADMATYPWLAVAMAPLRALADEALGATPGLDRWLADVAARPAVQRGMAVPKV
jgi:GST-like protein